MTVEAAVHSISGIGLSAYWVIPFAGLLLSIAFVPLVTPRLWHNHFGKLGAIWVALFIVPATLEFGSGVVFHEVLHVFFLEYMPFIVLLLALFTTGGGVRLVGQLPGTPAMNTVILIVGTLLASIMGTTGAAMLLIRPILKSNMNRKYRVHIVVFFIFLVANVGGSLTPLGDPPLFLGFLNGVDFFWPTVNMLIPMKIVTPYLLLVFYAMDRFLYMKEGKPAANVDNISMDKLKVEGKINFVLILGILAAVIMSGVWKPNVQIEVDNIPLSLPSLVRDGLLLFITFLSLRLTSKESRVKNGFSWFPMVEVAMLFSCIFICMIPALKILKAGADGELGFLISHLSDESGAPVNAIYFWVTGILSGFLDNAPTYLVFFNTAGGDPAVLMTELSGTLLAVSAGAVFFGAMTYIGNAPNFMVKAIAQERGIPMPSFFAYMLWSITILLPIYGLITWLFFV